MKVLFLTNHIFISNVYNGGGMCGKRNFDVLSKIAGSNSIYLCTLSSEKVLLQDSLRKYIEITSNLVLNYFNYMCLRARYSKRNESEIIVYINNVKPDIIFFDGTTFGNIANKIDKKIKTVAFFHNIEKNYSWNCVLHKNPLCILKFFSDWYNEYSLIKKANKVICLNERDKNAIYTIYKRKADLVWPITFYDLFNKKNLELKRSNTILFVGSYFPPNVDGIRWFAKNVMTNLKCKLIVVGKEMEILKSEIQCKNIEVIGTVDNLEMYYYKADAVIMPIFYGDGMKVKTAESLMYGKTIFATNEALEGYDVEGVDGIYRCNNQEEFIHNIKYFYNLPNSNNYNVNTRKIFLEKYETNIKHEEINQFLKALVQ